MINDTIIQTAREHFLTAAKELEFQVISPYCLDEHRGLYAFAYLPEFGSRNGAVVSLVSPPDYHVNNEVADWCMNNRHFHSNLNCELLIGDYNPDYFREMLNDWGRFRNV